MLTEADMIRIMAAKYSLAESIAEKSIENETDDVFGDDNSSERLCYEISTICDFPADN